MLDGSLPSEATFARDIMTSHCNRVRHSRTQMTALKWQKFDTVIRVGVRTRDITRLWYLLQYNVKAAEHGG